MPHLTNCAHSGDGWCLDCVSKLKTELDDLGDRHAKLYADITKTIIDRDKWREVAGRLREYASCTCDWPCVNCRNAITDYDNLEEKSK